MPTASVFARITKAGSVDGESLVTDLAPVGESVSAETQTITSGVATIAGGGLGVIPARAKITVTDWTFPDPYVTGGIAPSAASLGLTSIGAIIALQVTKPTDGTTKAFLNNADTTKVMLSVEDGTSGISAEHGGTSATGIIVRIVAIGF